MVAGLALARKLQLGVAALASALFLSACDPSGLGGPVINTRSAVPVALLVPATAPDGGAILARSLENAARLAIADLQGVEIDLRVYDTAGQPQQAAMSANRAVQDGARIIIGPVFAESAAAAGTAVASRGVNVLAFSNNPSVAGGNVFILGSTFDNTANRLARYAVLQGRTDIQIVHGNDSAETSARDAVSRAVVSNGGRVAGITGFDLSQQGVINAIPDIADQTRASGADALFMTSGTNGALPFLADLLPENGVDPAEVQFIGLQRLDIPASALSLGGLQGAWFALPDPGLTELFRSRYEAAYGQAPHPIAGLAYDSVAAIGALVSQGQSNALTVPALTQASGFAGVNGVFRLLPDGTNERALAVAQIQDNQVIVIDPAPRSFGLAGF